MNMTAGTQQLEKDNQNLSAGTGNRAREENQGIAGTRFNLQYEHITKGSALALKTNFIKRLCFTFLLSER